MSWANQWSYKVDGHELNDITNYFTQIPEIDNDPEQDPVMVEMEAGYPWLVRLQPVQGAYTILVQMRSCPWDVYQSRLAQLKGWLAPGVHTLTVQARGMGSAKSLTVVTRGMMVDAKLRRLAVTAVAPVPVWA